MCRRWRASHTRYPGATDRAHGRTAVWGREEGPRRAALSWQSCGDSPTWLRLARIERVLKVAGSADRRPGHSRNLLNGAPPAPPSAPGSGCGVKEAMRASGSPPAMFLGRSVGTAARGSVWYGWRRSSPSLRASAAAHAAQRCVQWAGSQHPSRGDGGAGHGRSGKNRPATTIVAAGQFPRPPSCPVPAVQLRSGPPAQCFPSRGDRVHGPGVRHRWMRGCERERIRFPWYREESIRCRRLAESAWLRAWEGPAPRALRTAGLTWRRGESAKLGNPEARRAGSLAPFVLSFRSSSVLSVSLWEVVLDQAQHRRPAECMNLAAPRAGGRSGDRVVHAGEYRFAIADKLVCEFGNRRRGSAVSTCKTPSWRRGQGRWLRSPPLESLTPPRGTMMQDAPAVPRAGPARLHIDRADRRGGCDRDPRRRRADELR